MDIVRQIHLKFRSRHLYIRALLDRNAILYRCQRSSTIYKQQNSRRMNSKRSRIAAFLDTLPSTNISEGAQSTLLKSSIEFVGGSTTNDGNCTNPSLKACDKSKNAGSCKNVTSYCDNSKNGRDCGPTTDIPVNPPIVANPVGMTCKG